MPETILQMIMGIDVMLYIVDRDALPVNANAHLEACPGIPQDTRVIGRPLKI